MSRLTKTHYHYQSLNLVLYIYRALLGGQAVSGVTSTSSSIYTGSSHKQLPEGFVLDENFVDSSY